LIPPFDWAGFALGDIGVLGAPDWRSPPGHQPSLDLGQVPNDTTRRERKPAGKLATLLHFINSAVSHRHHLAQLLPPDCSSNLRSFDLCHAQSPALLKRLRPIDADTGSPADIACGIFGQ